MKRLCALLLLLLMLGAAACAEEALIEHAKHDLMEDYGFTEADTERFVFEKQADGSLRFWLPERPAWIYTTAWNPENGHSVTATPFDTGVMGTKFATPRDTQAMLDQAKEKGWFADWNEEARFALTELCFEERRPSISLYLAQNAAQAVHGLFESLYGPAAGWTPAIAAWRDETLADYGLTLDALPFHVTGVRTAGLTVGDGIVHRRLTVFDGAVPEELQSAFSDPRLDGWQCVSGALLTHTGHFGDGFAIFEKDGRRMLLQLTKADGPWNILCLGENVLYQQYDCRVGYDMRNNFSIEYQLNDHETARFYVSPSASLTGEYPNVTCRLIAYERVNEQTGEAVWIGVDFSAFPTWLKEARWEGTFPRISFPPWLGAVPIDQFPTTLEDAKNAVYPGLPEGYTIVCAVNLRAQTSSRSKSLGMLCPGVLLPVLDTLPGDPYPWIKTRIGFLEGYVAANYALGGDSYSNYRDPQPLAEADTEITLKKGKTLLDGKVASFPAGTRMHVVIDDGDWLYVDVPRGEMTFLMDPEGTFGYVRASDVHTALLPGQLDWMK